MTGHGGKNDMRDNGGLTVQALWLSLASLMSMSVGIVTSMVLSRLLDQTEYGTYRQVIYVYYTLLMVFSLGLPKAYSYFLARMPLSEGRAAVRKINLLFICLASAFSALLFFGAGWIAQLLGNPLLEDNLKYFSVTPMLLMPVLGVENILTVYGMSEKVVLYTVISRSFTILCTVLSVVFVGATASVAVCGFVLSSAATCAVGLRLSYLPFRGTVQKDSGLGLKEIFRFSWPVFTSGIYGFVISSASQFFVSRYFGVGDFAVFANGYHELPFAGMIFSATSSVLLPKFSKMSREGVPSAGFMDLWKSVVFKSLAIIWPLSVFSCIFADDIICFMYGDAYAASADLFRIVTLVSLVRIVPGSAIMLALGKGREFSRAHLFTAVSLVSLDALCVRYFPSLTGIAFISTFTTCMCIIIIMRVIVRSLGASLADVMPWDDVLKMFAAASAAGACSFFAVSVIGLTHHLANVVIGFVLFMPLYFLVAHLSGVDYQSLSAPVVSYLRKKIHK